MNIQLLNDRAKVPTRGSEYAAGYDLYAALESPIEIPPGECRKIPTGIATEIPNNLFGAVFPRSGLAVKRGLRLANSCAIIDADYRGEWLIPLYNDSQEIQIINPEDRIAQVIFLAYSAPMLIPVESLNETERGPGGFGSTGIK